MTSRCGKSKEVAHELQASVSLMFFPHFEVLFDLLLDRPTERCNLFVLYNDQKRKKTDTYFNISASYLLTVRGFVIV